MPKRSVAARSGAQRQKPRAQKSFELVRPEVEDDGSQLGTVPTQQDVASEMVAATPQESRPSARAAKGASTMVAAPEPVLETKSASEPKISAATRMAARRQAAQRTQRNSTTLITAEHFAYVRRDLVVIAILAILMFVAIIVLYLVFGRGA